MSTASLLFTLHAYWGLVGLCLSLSRGGAGWRSGHHCECCWPVSRRPSRSPQVTECSSPEVTGHFHSQLFGQDQSHRSAQPHGHFKISSTFRNCFRDASYVKALTPRPGCFVSLGEWRMSLGHFLCLLHQSPRTIKTTNWSPLPWLSLPGMGTPHLPSLLGPLCGEVTKRTLP